MCSLFRYELPADLIVELILLPPLSWCIPVDGIQRCRDAVAMIKTTNHLDMRQLKATKVLTDMPSPAENGFSSPVHEHRMRRAPHSELPTPTLRKRPQLGENTNSESRCRTVPSDYAKSQNPYISAAELDPRSPVLGSFPSRDEMDSMFISPNASFDDAQDGENGFSAKIQRLYIEEQASLLLTTSATTVSGFGSGFEPDEWDWEENLSGKTTSTGNVLDAETEAESEVNQCRSPSAGHGQSELQLSMNVKNEGCRPHSKDILLDVGPDKNPTIVDTEPFNILPPGSKNKKKKKKSKGPGNSLDSVPTLSVPVFTPPGNAVRQRTSSNASISSVVSGGTKLSYPRIDDNSRLDEQLINVGNTGRRRNLVANSGSLPQKESSLVGTVDANSNHLMHQHSTTLALSGSLNSPSQQRQSFSPSPLVPAHVGSPLQSTNAQHFSTMPTAPTAPIFVSNSALLNFQPDTNSSSRGSGSNNGNLDQSPREAGVSSANDFIVVQGKKRSSNRPPHQQQSLHGHDRHGQILQVPKLQSQRHDNQRNTAPRNYQQQPQQLLHQQGVPLLQPTQDQHQRNSQHTSHKCIGDGTGHPQISLQQQQPQYPSSQPQQINRMHHQNRLSQQPSSQNQPHSASPQHAQQVQPPHYQQQPHLHQMPPHHQQHQLHPQHQQLQQQLQLPGNTGHHENLGSLVSQLAPSSDQPYTQHHVLSQQNLERQHQIPQQTYQNYSSVPQFQHAQYPGVHQQSPQVILQVPAFQQQQMSPGYGLQQYPQAQSQYQPQIQMHFQVPPQHVLSQNLQFVVDSPSSGRDTYDVGVSNNAGGYISNSQGGSNSGRMERRRSYDHTNIGNSVGGHHNYGNRQQSDPGNHRSRAFYQNNCYGFPKFDSARSN
jgi:hypothetical protein